MATKRKKTTKPESTLTTAAQAVGTALGKLALKAGLKRPCKAAGIGPDALIAGQATCKTVLTPSPAICCIRQEALPLYDAESDLPPYVGPRVGSGQYHGGQFRALARTNLSTHLGQFPIAHAGGWRDARAGQSGWPRSCAGSTQSCASFSDSLFGNFIKASQSPISRACRRFREARLARFRALG